MDTKDELIINLEQNSVEFNSKDVHQDLHTDTYLKSVSLMLQIFLEAQKLRASGIRFEASSLDQKKIKLLFESSQGENKPPSVLKKSEVAVEDIPGLIHCLTDRSFYWPPQVDISVAPSLGKTKRILFAPISPFRLLCDFSFNRKAVLNSPLISIDSIRWTDIKPITNFLYLNEKQKFWLLTATKARNGIILANTAPEQHGLDASATVLALRPDALFYKGPLTNSACCKLIDLAADHLVIVGINCLDPIDMLYMFLSSFPQNKERLKDCCMRLLLSYVERYIKRVCGSCAKTTQVVPSTMEQIPKVLQSLVVKSYMFGRGCDKCGNSAYKGVVAVDSLIGIDKELQVLLFDKISAEAFAQTVYKKGTRSLIEDGLTKIENGLTSFEEVFSITTNISSAFAYAIANQSQDNTMQKDTSVNHALSENILGDQASGTKVRLLIIEDEIEQKDVLQIVFATAGYEVVTAQNGKHALELLASESVDAILCDVMMPIMNGMEFLLELRKQSEFKQIPVMILTAAENAEDELQFLSKGANDYCSKTLKRKVLLQRVERLFNNKPKSNPVEHLLSE